MADDSMQKYLNSIGLVKNETWMKIGTDPKTNNMKKMWLALQILLIPDYIFVHKDKLWLSEVKGTLKLKESDYLHVSCYPSKYKEIPPNSVIYDMESHDSWLDSNECFKKSDFSKVDIFTL